MHKQSPRVLRSYALDNVSTEWSASIHNFQSICPPFFKFIEQC